MGQPVTTTGQQNTKAQIQGEGIVTLPLNGRSIKEFTNLF